MSIIKNALLIIIIAYVILGCSNNKCREHNLLLISACKQSNDVNGKRNDMDKVIKIGRDILPKLEVALRSNDLSITQSPEKGSIIYMIANIKGAEVESILYEEYRYTDNVDYRQDLIIGLAIANNKDVIHDQLIDGCYFDLKYSQDGIPLYKIWWDNVGFKKYKSAQQGVAPEPALDRNKN